MPLEKGRRSSILKPSKVRNPLGELDQLRPTENNDDDGCTTTTTEITRNRRVSFSRKKGVALFTSEEGNTIWHNIYEEHNKPDLSDSGGGSHLHISMDEDKPDIKQEPNKHNSILPAFNTEVNDDDETEHCVDIKAMLTGIKRQPEKELPNLVFELSQPSISDRTDILINYKIQEDGASLTETRIKAEEPQVKLECNALVGDDDDKLFEAEMSITQDVPIVIVTNKNNKAETETKSIFEVSLLEDKAKWREDKENRKMLQECLEHMDDQGMDIKEEIVIKNESIHIEDMYFPGSKRSMSNVYHEDIPDKKIKSESNDPNVSDGDMSFTKVLDNNILNEREQDCDMSVTYCFTKEVRMNNKRETIGYNIKNLDMSLTCPNNEDFDPFADIKTANLSIKSNRPSEFFMNDSVENVVDTSIGNEKNFEFVECDNVNNSVNEDNLNTSDVLKVKPDESFNADLENKDKHQLVNKMSDAFKENQPLGAGRKSVVFDADTDVRTSKTNVNTNKNSTKENVLKAIGTNKKNILFDDDDIDCNMSMNDIVCAMKERLDRECDNKQIHTDTETDQQEKQQDGVFDKENIRNIQPSDNKLEASSFDSNSVNSNKPVVPGFPQFNENHNRKTIVFDNDIPESNMSITNVVTSNDGRRNDRKTIHFDPNNSDCDMSMTNVLALNNWNSNDNRNTEVKENIASNPMSVCDLSITGVFPLDEMEEKTSNKRKTIVFDPEMPDSNVSMTCVLPLRSQTETKSGKTFRDETKMDCDMSITRGALGEERQQDKRKTIVFDSNTSIGNMSMTNVACVLPQNYVDTKDNEPYYDVTMKSVAYDNAGANTNRRTILFDQSEENGDMSMTNVLQVEPLCGGESADDMDNPCNNIEKEIIAKVSDEYSKQTEKRKTILFDQNNLESNMSMTSGIPIKELLSMDNCERENTNPSAREKPNRKTIVFNESMPEFNMSMTNVMPTNNIVFDHKTDKRKTIHFNQDMPDCDMSMTNMIPVKCTNKDGDKRKTIHFNQDMPDCDMSMTNIIPVKCIGKDVDKRKTIHYNQDIPECEMSMTNIIPVKCIDKDVEKRKTIHFNQDMPDCNMSITNMMPVKCIDKDVEKRKTIHFNQEMPDCDMSITNIMPVKCIDKDVSKRKTINFNQDMPDCNMSITNIIPVKCIDQDVDKRKTIHFNQDIPESEMSMTNIIPVKCCSDRAIDKRRTIHFDQEMPDGNMSMTRALPVQINDGRNVDKKKSEYCDKENSLGNDANTQPTIPNIPSYQVNESHQKQDKLSDNPKTQPMIEPVFGRFDETVSGEICGDKEAPQTTITGTCGSRVQHKDVEKANEFINPSSEIIRNQMVSNKIRLTMNDEMNCTDDKYFEQACKSLLNNSKLIDRSCLSMSGIMPRIPPNTNMNITMNSVSSFMPDIDKTKSVLYDNHVMENKIMEISKCFEGYRDPCKSANNSLFAADKSNLSLPNIEDSGLEDHLMTPRIRIEKGINITTNSFAMLPPDFAEKSVHPDKSIFENKLQMTCNLSLECSKQNVSMMMNVNENTLFVDQTLPKISETLMMDKSVKIYSNIVKVIEDDFHMSVDEINMCDTSVKCFKDVEDFESQLANVKKAEITADVQKEFIADVEQNDKSIQSNVETLEKSVIGEKCHVDDVANVNVDSESVKISDDVDKSISDGIKVNLEMKMDQHEPLTTVYDQVLTCIVPDTKNNPASSNLEPKDKQTSQCQNIINKNTAENDKTLDVNIEINPTVSETKINADDNMKKISEKRKSDNDSKSMDSFNNSQPKKQKIIVPEVCSWLKEVISINNKSHQNSTSIQQEEIEPPTPKCLNEDIDSHTYTISRGQLEQFAKIKELNEDVNDQLNGSDHFIENVNMSLVDSSLDAECGKCGNNKSSETVENVNCENCKNNMENDIMASPSVRINSSNAERRKNSFCESLGTSTETENSPLRLPDNSYVTETKPVTEPPKKLLKQIIEECVHNLDTCNVSFESREVVFTLMRRHIRLRVVLGGDLTKDSDHMIPVSDILLEQKTVSSSNMASFFQSVAAKMAMYELDVRSLKSMCVMGGDIPKMVIKCCQVADSAWRWARECYPLFAKYNLRLVDEQKWTFEICDGYHLCVWDVEIKLQNRRVLHYTKPENVKIKTAMGKCPISDSLFKDVIESVHPGWMFIPDLISGLHALIRNSRKVC